MVSGTGIQKVQDQEPAPAVIRCGGRSGVGNYSYFKTRLHQNRKGRLGKFNIENKYSPSKITSLKEFP